MERPSNRTPPSNRHRYFAQELSLEEGQEISVYRRCLCGRHAVWKSLIGLQCSVLQKLRRQWCGIPVGNDLIVVAVHHQHWHADLLEVHDAVVVRFRAAHHALAPPVGDDRFQGFSPRPTGAARRTVAEHDGLTLTPVFVKNFNAVLRFDKTHVTLPDISVQMNVEWRCLAFTRPRKLAW